jgi:Na+-driven multidrug efflux pump
MKVFQKGIIRSLSLQDKAVYIHLVGNWALNMALQYFFVYKLNKGLLGIWISKIIMETFVVTC